MNTKLYFLSLCIFTLALISSVCNNNQKNNRIDFDVNGQSILYIKNDSIDTLNIKVINWYLLPLKEQKFDTLINPNQTIELSLKTQGKSYYDLKIGEQAFKIFTIPNAIDSISIRAEQPIIFSGDLKNINEFILKKSMFFNSVDAEWMPRTEITRSSNNVQEIINFNDSITQIHLEYLDENSSSLPDWFIDYEYKRQKYLNAGFILNSVLYRNMVLNMQDSLPPGFLSNVINQIDLQDESMVGDAKYVQFFHDYIIFRINPELKTELSEDEKKLSYKEYIDIPDKEFTGLTRDFYFSRLICIDQDHAPHLLDKSLIEYINDKNLKSFVQNYIKTSPLLPAGSPIPYFYLPDEHGNYHEPAQYKDSILYLNFWATWCKPCIKEFPHENSLVDKFKDQPVKIINICIESDTVKWKEYINKHNLKTLNLIAIDKWNDKLKKDFDIQGIPHSVLIGPNGKIVQNKSPKASQIEAEIIRLIDKTNKPVPKSTATN